MHRRIFVNDFFVFLRNRKRLAGPFHPAINLHSQLFAVSLDGRHIYAGGIWDASLKVFNVSRGKNVASITRHLGKMHSIPSVQSAVTL